MYVYCRVFEYRQPYICVDWPAPFTVRFVLNLIYAMADQLISRFMPCFYGILRRGRRRAKGPNAMGGQVSQR